MSPAKVARLGGFARARRMSAKERSLAAGLASAARWARYRAEKGEDAARPSEAPAA